MKHLAPLLLALAAFFAPGCSDDGVYPPLEHPVDAGPEPVQACQFEDVSLCDAGEIDAAKP